MQLIATKDVFRILSATLDMVDARLVHHGKRVAYMVYQMLLAEGGHHEYELVDDVFTSILHDIGAYKTEEIDNMVEFETNNVLGHSIYGYLFLKNFSPLPHMAEAVLHHHLNYELYEGQSIPEPQAHLAQLIKLADRVDILLHLRGLDFDRSVLANLCPSKFSPYAFALFCKADREGQTIEKLHDGRYEEELEAFLSSIRLPEVFTQSLLQMLAFAIDFRSEFTVIHTLTTVSISCELALLMGFDSPQEQQLIYYGAFLHDLGKIAIPIEILEKPGPLTQGEMSIMRRHVNLTAQILGNGVHRTVLNLALRHHEKVDGSGYPLGLRGDELTLPEQIVAVADIVSALRSRRSYKEPFPKEQVLSILANMAQTGAISAQVTEVVTQHYDRIMEITNESCQQLLTTYEGMQCSHHALLAEYGELYRPDRARVLRQQ